MNTSQAIAIHLLPEQEEKDKKEEGEEETEDEKKKRIGYPSNDINELLTEFDCEESIPKLKEHEINAEKFWTLEEGDLKSMLDIKIYGRVKRLTKKIKEIKKEHEK